MTIEGDQLLDGPLVIRSEVTEEDGIRFQQ